MRLGIAVSLAAVAGALLGGVAVVALLGPSDSGPPTEPVLAEVSEATVGRTLSLNAVATRGSDRPLYNRVAGTVTAVGASSGAVLGEVLYEVDDEPVVAVAGDVPFWRDLDVGVVGPDVAQFERLLLDLRLLDQADEQFSSATRTAVEAWRDDHLDIDREGPVPLGRLLAVPADIAGVKLGESVVLGAILQGGEVAAVGLAGEPEFTIPLTQSQTALLPVGTEVSLMVGDSPVSGSITDIVEVDGTPIASLGGGDGGPLCPAPCHQVPGEATSTVPVEVVLTPAVSGPAVPIAAVRTAADGSAFVTTAHGRRVPIEVRGEGDGLAVVDGLELGVQVVVTEADGAVSS